MGDCSPRGLAIPSILGPRVNQLKNGEYSSSPPCLASLPVQCGLPGPTLYKSSVSSRWEVQKHLLRVRREWRGRIPERS